MRVWILAGFFSAAMAPVAAATEIVADCQLEETRRSTAERVETTPPPASVARPVAAQREVVAEAVVRAKPERRRNGKRIPDAELIGPRGAL